MKGLCFRCDYRASYLESKDNYRPRSECKDLKSSVCGCWMFRPVRPIITKLIKGYPKETRFDHALIKGRERGVRVTEDDVRLKKHHINKKESFLYWRPYDKT